MRPFPSLLQQPHCMLNIGLYISAPLRKQQRLSRRRSIHLASARCRRSIRPPSGLPWARLEGSPQYAAGRSKTARKCFQSSGMPISRVFRNCLSGGPALTSTSPPIESPASPCSVGKDAVAIPAPARIAIRNHARCLPSRWRRQDLPWPAISFPRPGWGFLTADDSNRNARRAAPASFRPLLAVLGAVEGVRGGDINGRGRVTVRATLIRKCDLSSGIDASVYLSCRS